MGEHRVVSQLRNSTGKLVKFLHWICQSSKAYEGSFVNSDFASQRVLWVIYGIQNQKQPLFS